MHPAFKGMRVCSAHLADIRTVIQNANGSRQSLFVPEESFELLARMQIARLEQPGLQCAEMVFNELRRVVMQCRPAELRRFTGLHERVIDVANEMLRTRP